MRNDLASDPLLHVDSGDKQNQIAETFDKYTLLPVVMRSGT